MATARFPSTLKDRTPRSATTRFLVGALLVGLLVLGFSMLVMNYEPSGTEGRALGANDEASQQPQPATGYSRSEPPRLPGVTDGIKTST